MNKIVFLDWGVFVHRAIFSWRNNRAVPPTYTAQSMIIACLKRIELTPEDLIVIAVDSPKGSWRRDVDRKYKADRKEKRESFEDINWSQQFYYFDRLLNNLEQSTPFHAIEIDKLEADDIIGYGVRYYKDNECVIISSDSDYEQLAVYENVKLFSPLTKKYKIIKNPQRILASKINREAGDNLVTPILNKQDYEKRRKIVCLTELPPEVESKVKERLSNINCNKEYSLERLRSKNIRARFMDIYNNDKVITEADTLKSIKKKKAKSKAKKHAQTKLL